MNNTPKSFLTRFLRLESASGIILMFAALIAVVFANTPLQSYYALLIETPVEIRIGALHIAKPLLLWINDGLMAIFFFMIGRYLLDRYQAWAHSASHRRLVGLPVWRGCAVRRRLYNEFIYRVAGI